MSVIADTFVSRQLCEQGTTLTEVSVLPAPYIPPTDSSLEFDTSNFDKTFLTMDTNLKRDSVLLNGQDASRKEASAFDDSTFAVYDYAERGSDSDDEDTPSPDFQSPSGRRASLSLSDDDAVESGSDTVSTSVSSLDIEDGLGVPAMQGIPEEPEYEDLSTETATAYRTGDGLPGKMIEQVVGQEHTSVILQRIQALTSEPGIKFSSRHSREASRASVEHGRKESADDWTILDARPEGEAPNGRSPRGQTLSARGVVDKYRLAIRKRRGAALRKKPSWRSPTSSLIFGKAGGNSNGNDTEKPSSGFLTPLSPTLADLKNRLRGRAGKKRSTSAKSSSQEASSPRGETDMDNDKVHSDRPRVAGPDPYTSSGS
jgi:hypothetical protein